ncbi:MAG: hypothetical protein JWO94_38, partial [Verrucomicrobiaceae bacterium]|nr:hypothetical protein [Verrucomicrobiaceae bacterium]
MTDVTHAPFLDMKQHFLFTPLLPSVPKFFLLAASLMFGLLALTAPAVAETRYVEGSVIVTFKPAATLNDAKAVLNKKSLGFANHFGWLSAKRNRTTGLVRHQTKSTADLIASLKDDPTVESVEPDYLRWVNGAPNDPRFSDMWGLRNQGQTVDGTTGTSGDDVKFVEAWNEATANTNNVVVGVIDSGVDYVHPDLAGNMWVNTAELQSGGVDNDNNGYKNDYFGYDFVNGLSHPDDSGYHGTHVAGTIAAIGNNQAGVIGVNYRAKIMALKVSSDGESISTSAVILALQYATLMKGRGVNIVALNASYGGGGSSTAERAAIQAAGDAGIILCAAAGNEKASNDATPSYPANYRLSNMIVVAASDQDDALASFSNYGTTTVDLAAPGTSILSTKPSTVSVQVGSKSYVSTPITFSGLTSGLSGKLVSCGIGDVTATTTDFPAAVRGNIAFISRGTLTFEDKVKNAMAAGAIGAVIYNNVPGSFAGTMSKAGDFIPAVAISEEDGLAILPSAPTTASLVIAGDYQYLDGTSMATPHVTGAVAFAAMNFPADTVAQRIARILNHVDVKASLQGKVTSNGRLNLLKIVDANSNGVPDWLEATGPNAPVISTSGALPGVVLNDSYSQTLSATGGTSPYTWDVANGALPGGLALSPAGVLSGTPTAVGSFSFAVRVIDSVNAANAKSFTLTVASTPLSINTDPSLTNGKMGVDYHISLVA